MPRILLISFTLIIFVISSSGCEKLSIKIESIPDQRVSVGQTLSFNIHVTGAKGKTVVFSFSSDLQFSGATLSRVSSDTAVFLWTPRREHEGYHVFTFTAAVEGSKDSESVEIQVLPSSSAPVFLQPGAGGTYDLSRDPCVKVHIEIKDDDTTPENIRIWEGAPAIEGATLQQTGKTADWNWCPSRRQTEANDRYTLILMAQDESHPPVRHPFIIVLRGLEKGNCPGQPPQILSSSPPPPQLVASSMDFEVHAQITDDQGIKEMPILYYTFQPPPEPSKPDITAFEQVFFESTGGNDYIAYIPNPGLTEEDTMTVYYIISVTDNDDVEGVLCDHRVDSSLRQFNITGGGGQLGGYCDRCSASLQCDSGGCVRADEPFCGSACESCPSGAQCQEVITVEGYYRSLCVPPELNCSGEVQCSDDSFEDNDTRATATAITSGVYNDLQICPYDEDFYSLQITESSQVFVQIYGWDGSSVDIDLQLQSSDGTPIKTSAGLLDWESVSSCLADAGRYYIRVYGIIDDSGPYSLDLSITPGSCCVDDTYEDNDTYLMSIPIYESSPISAAICSSDDDWFSIDAPAGRKLIADMAIEGTGDLDLELYDIDGMTRLSASAGITSTEHLEYDITVTGTYFLRVFGYGGGEGSYTLSVSFGETSTCSSTSECNPGSICDGTICVDDGCYSSTECPENHFCPDVGGAGGESDCVDECSDSSTCREGYACKVFEEGNGCAIAGSGYTGDGCDSFRDCWGELVCLSIANWSGGYCARIECIDNSDCPADAYCVEVSGMLLGVCLLDCEFFSTYCRYSEDYSCRCAQDVNGENRNICVPESVTTPSCSG